MVEGSTNRSYGIQVARLAGIPPHVLKRAKKILSNIEKGEKGPDGVPIFAEGENIDKRGPYQLDLFIRPELRIIQELKKLDVYQMTPLDALNCLNELHEKAKKDNSNS
jgi:DNA mismatch repair protein MutS